MDLNVQKELLAIKGDAELLNPQDVVAWARANKMSALHRKFQWDIRKAAKEHWLETARKLIRIHVSFASEVGPQLVSLSIDRKPGGGYRDVDAVAASRDLYQILLSDAIKELRRIQQKYARVKELAPLWGELENVDRRNRPETGDNATAA